MKALRRLTVRAAFPPELVKLGDLVANLRWSWHAESLDLFESVDPELWTRAGTIRAACSARSAPSGSRSWPATASSSAALDDLHDDLTDYLTQPRWYQKQQAAGRRTLPESIAYFSPGVRHHRGAAAVLRRPRHPGR